MLEINRIPLKLLPENLGLVLVLTDLVINFRELPFILLAHGPLIVELVGDNLEFSLDVEDFYLYQFSLVRLFLDIFLKLGNDVLIVLALFEDVDSFSQFFDLFNQVLVFLCEQLVLFSQRLIIELDKVDVDAHLLTLEYKLALALELLPQKVILPHNILGILMKILALLLRLLNLLLKQGYLMLVGHEQRFHIIELLQHFGVVDLWYVLGRTQFLNAEAGFLAHYG